MGKVETAVNKRRGGPEMLRVGLARISHLGSRIKGTAAQYSRRSHYSCG